MKYFVISLHRTGTRSVDAFFSDHGYRTVHWPVVVDGIDFQAKVAGRETDAAFVCQTLAPVIEGHDVLSDVPFPGLYRELATRYPDAKFILFYRHAFDWVASVRAHLAGSGALQPFVRVVYWQYFPSRPTDLNDLSDRDLLTMHGRHFSDVLSFFQAQPERLAVIDMNGRNVGRELRRFADLPGLGQFPAIGDHRKKRGLSNHVGEIGRRLIRLQSR